MDAPCLTLCCLSSPRLSSLRSRCAPPVDTPPSLSVSSRSSLYFVMDACLGGDLHFQLMRSPKKRFNEQQIRFYAASIIAGLEYMHSEGTHTTNTLTHTRLWTGDKNLR